MNPVLSFHSPSLHLSEIFFTLGLGQFRAVVVIISAFIDRILGAIIETDFVYNGTSAEEGYCKFPDFARKAFRTSTLSAFPWFAFVINLLTDNHYDSDILDQTLQGLYKLGHKLFDVLPASPAGIRVAIVASRISDGKPRVFTNYRGEGRTAADPPYEVSMPQNGTQDPLLWEV